MFVVPDGLSTAVFLLVVAFVLAAPLAGTWRATRDPRRVGALAVGLAAWLTAMSAFVATGVLERAPIPWLPVFFGLGLLGATVLALSPVGRGLAEHVPLGVLIGFQGFRLPLELVLHSWADQGTIPWSMTWEGSNVDIVTGLLSLLAAPWVGRSRALAAVVNAVGLLLLVNVGRVAILSSPVPFGWGVEPPLALAAHLPYAWIGPVCVAGAWAGHLVVFRALRVTR